ADGILRPSTVGSLAGLADSALGSAQPTIDALPRAGTASARAPASATVGADDDTPGDTDRSIVTLLSNPLAAQPDEILTNHVVRPGDTLAKLAIRYYGDKDLFDRIFNANRDVLSDPEQLRIGIALRIPAPQNP
ncbi:MAG: LysM peptidoglycan-binding domain-containing protein, partial [Pseudomonadota bacterium]